MGRVLLVYNIGRSCMINIKKFRNITKDERKELFKKLKSMGITNYGNFNQMPEPYHPCTSPAAYLRRHYSYSPIAYEFRQVPDIDFGIEGDKKPFRSYKIYWYSDCGWASTLDYSTGNILTVYLGCDHDFRELSLEECRERNIMHWGMCYHVYECEHCGYIKSQDSSG